MCTGCKEKSNYAEDEVAEPGDNAGIDDGAQVGLSRTHVDDWRRSGGRNDGHLLMLWWQRRSSVSSAVDRA